MDTQNFIILSSEALPKFEVTVKFMSGDADAYTYETSTFENEDKVAEFVDQLRVFQKYQDDRRDFSIEKIAEALGWSEELVEDFVSEFPCDVTCDSYKARLYGWEIVAYDNNVKYELKIRS